MRKMNLHIAKSCVPNIRLNVQGLTVIILWTLPVISIPWEWFNSKFYLYFNIQVFGLLSAEVKIIPALTEENIQKVVQLSGITLLKQVDSDSYTVHGSWQSLQRARNYLVIQFGLSSILFRARILQHLISLTFL